MMTPGTSSRASSRESSEMPWPTPSTPGERPSPPWTSSTLSRDKEEPSTVSEDDLHYHCYPYFHSFLSKPSQPPLFATSHTPTPTHSQQPQKHTGNKIRTERTNWESKDALISLWMLYIQRNAISISILLNINRIASKKRKADNLAGRYSFVIVFDKVKFYNFQWAIYLFNCQRSLIFLISMLGLLFMDSTEYGKWIEQIKL